MLDNTVRCCRTAAAGFLLRQFRQIRRIDLAPIGCDITEPQIIGQDDDDIGLPGGRGLRCCQGSGPGK